MFTTSSSSSTSSSLIDDYYNYNKYLLVLIIITLARMLPPSGQGVDQAIPYSSTTINNGIGLLDFVIGMRNCLKVETVPSPLTPVSTLLTP